MPIEPDTFDANKIILEQKDPIIQYYIVRKDIKMSRGKMCAQVAHGAQKFIMTYLERVNSNPIRYWDDLALITTWINEGYRKVFLGGKQKDFEKIKEELFIFSVTDAGLTEIESGTETLLVTWPMLKSQRPKVISRLQLLTDEV